MYGSNCAYKWLAPLALRGSGVKYVEQTCELAKGHAGPHRTAFGVVCPREEES